MTTIYKQQDNSLAEAIYTIVNLCCNTIFLHHTNARGNSTSKKKKKEISVISTAARILKLFVHVVFIAKLSDSQAATI